MTCGSISRLSLILKSTIVGDLLMPCPSIRLLDTRQLDLAVVLFSARLREHEITTFEYLPQMVIAMRANFGTRIQISPAKSFKSNFPPEPLHERLDSLEMSQAPWLVTFPG